MRILPRGKALYAALALLLVDPAVANAAATLQIEVREPSRSRLISADVTIRQLSGRIVRRVFAAAGRARVYPAPVGTFIVEARARTGSYQAKTRVSIRTNQLARVVVRLAAAPKIGTVKTARTITPDRRTATSTGGSRQTVAGSPLRATHRRAAPRGRRAAGTRVRPDPHRTARSTGGRRLSDVGHANRGRVRHARPRRPVRQRAPRPRNRHRQPRLRSWSPARLPRRRLRQPRPPRLGDPPALPGSAPGRPRPGQRRLLFPLRPATRHLPASLHRDRRPAGRPLGCDRQLAGAGGPQAAIATGLAGLAPEAATAYPRACPTDHDFREWSGATRSRRSRSIAPKPSTPSTPS